MSKERYIISGVWLDEGSGVLYMARCPKCDRENYIMNVNKGICTWCGYDAHELLNKQH